MRKKLGRLMVLITAAVAWTSVSLEAETAFDDVEADYWALDEIRYLSDEGVIHGYPDGSFAPNQEVTRQQAAGMIAEALNLELGGRLDPGFTDVDEGSPYYRDIAATAEEGIFQGSDNVFRPGETMTRAQMAVVLARAFDAEESDRAFYVDVPSSHWTFDEVAAITQAGIARGKTDRRSFAPNEAVTRAQLSVFLTRGLEENERLETPPAMEAQLQKYPVPDARLDMENPGDDEVLAFVQGAETWRMDVISIPSDDRLWTISEEEKQAMSGHLGSLFAENVVNEYMDRFYKQQGEVYVFQEGDNPLIPENDDETEVEAGTTGGGKLNIKVSAAINQPGITFTHESVYNGDNGIFEQFSTVSD